MGAYINSTVEKAVADSLGSDVYNIELSSGARHESEDIIEYVNMQKKLDMRFVVHNYFPVPSTPFVLNLASNNPELRSRSIAHCQTAIDITAAIDAPFYSLHSGFCIDPSPDSLGTKLTGKSQARNTGLRIFIESLEQVAEYAAKKGVSILIENNVVTRANLKNGKNDLLLGVTADELNYIFESVDADNLGLLLDVAHLKVSANTLGFSAEETVAKLASKIFCCHLSDNNGLVDSNQKVDSDSWFWDPLAKYLSHAPVWVLEVYNIDMASIVSQVKLIRETFSQLNPALINQD